MTEHEPSRYTRRELGSLLLKAGAGAALAASLPEIRTARSDGEAQPEVPEAGFCENPTVKNNPEISIRNQRLYGVKVCFRDQPEGAEEVEQNAGLYDKGFMRIFNDMKDNGIWKRYMRIETSYELLPGIYWSKYNFAEHRAIGFHHPNELELENPLDIWYDGNIYPILIYIYTSDSVRVRPRPNSLPNEFFLRGPVGARLEHSSGRIRGIIQLPWTAVIPELEGLHDVAVLEHERGHALGRNAHSSNRRSVMSISPLRKGAILDVNDVSRMCTYKVYLPIGHGPQIP